MGTIFEELVRRFNEENNEEAGEHWTPRDAVKLMAKLIFLPIADEIESGTYLLYDGACGTGGMLTVAEETLQQLADGARQAGRHAPLRPGDQRRDLRHLQGRPAAQGRGRRRGQHRRRAGALDARQRRLPVARVRLHALQSALRQELEERPGAHGRQGRHQGPALRDRARRRPRVLARHPLQRRPDALPGQHALQDEARHASSAAASPRCTTARSLFTGDAGQGESNIRRWIIENDWLEAIVALPLNMFYNTGIATYIWVLTNRKPEHRAGQGAAHRRHAVVQAAAQEPRQEELRAVRGRHPAHLRHVPRLRGDRAVEDLPQRRLRLLEGDRRAAAAPEGHRPRPRLHRRRRSRRSRRRPSATKTRRRSSRRSTRSGTDADPLRGLFEATIDGKPRVVEYEPDPDLRDTEQVPLLEEGGIEAFLRREVLPHAADAWYDPTASRSATRSASPATSTSRSRCARWRRSARTSWRSRRRPKDCSPRSSGKDDVIHVAAAQADGADDQDLLRAAVKIADLKPYPAMKDSGVPWLGEVPEHWEVRKLGQIGRLSKGNGGNKEDEVATGVPCVRYGDLYTTHTYFIRKSRSFVTPARANDYTRIVFGDVLFAASGETIDEIGKSAVNLIQSEARCGGDVILFRPGREVEARYMGYATTAVQRPPKRPRWDEASRSSTSTGTNSGTWRSPSHPSLNRPRSSAFSIMLTGESGATSGRSRGSSSFWKAEAGHHPPRRNTRPRPQRPPQAFRRGVARDVPENWVVASLRFRYHQCLGKMVMPRGYRVDTSCHT